MGRHEHEAVFGIFESVMLYSNPEYFVFLFCALMLYATVGRTQNSRLWILVSASTFFYVWAGIFDAVIFVSILVVSWGAVWMAHQAKHRRTKQLLLGGGILLMLLHLCFWKYVPWLCLMVQEFSPTFMGGTQVSFPLPVGISFFTLQGIAYLIDFGRGDAQFVKFKDYLLFKSFFPQLVAGPIVRMRQVGPQLTSLDGLNLDCIRSGLLLFSIGFFKKVAIADRMAVVVDPVFSNPENYGPKGICLALLAYSVQIWGDFSGYTDMGRGAAKMFGIELPENFFSPYFSKSPSEFWRRWHVTLSQWIRDYIYIPLGGANGSNVRACSVVILTMAISGLWHGSALTFIAWGMYHGVLLVLERLTQIAGVHIFEKKRAVIFTFPLIMFGWMIFRSESIAGLGKIVAICLGSMPAGDAKVAVASVLWGSTCCFLFQWLSYRPLENGQFKDSSPIPGGEKIMQFTLDHPMTMAFASGLGAAMLIAVALLMRVNEASNKFIYFQF